MQIAVAAFDARNTDELNFAVGDVIDVVEVCFALTLIIIFIDFNRRPKEVGGKAIMTVYWAGSLPITSRPKMRQLDRWCDPTLYDHAPFT